MVEGDDADAAGRVAAVVRALGGEPIAVERLPGGVVNHAFRVARAAGGDVVVRLPADPLHGSADDYADEYGVEAWAADAAGAAGVPVAAPVAHGRLDGVPYSVSRYVAHAVEPVRAPWTWLGRCAALIATADLTGAPPGVFTRFGADLDLAWSSHLSYHAAQLDRDDALLHDGAYRSAGSVRRRLDVLAAGRLRHGLAHGDLAPRNLVPRGPGRPPVLVDWGAASTGPAPWTDARRVFERAFVDHEIAARDYDEFAEAAGVSSASGARTVAALAAVHLVDVTRWARERRPALYAGHLARCRRGLDALDRVAPP